MGKKKIELKRIECPKERSNKYSKRRKGLLKKAEELAVLCDVDVMLLVFSPTSKPTLFHSRSRPFSKILEKFYMMSQEERGERRAYTKETLKKQLKRKNTEILTENQYLSSRRDGTLKIQKEGDKLTELREARESLDKTILILRDWQNPDRVDDLARLKIMEDHLVSTLSQIRELKIEED